MSEENSKTFIHTQVRTENRTKEENYKRKFSDDSMSAQLNTSFDSLTTPNEFSKHISNYCTKYLDFDNFSEEVNSYMVLYIYLL